MWWTKKWTRDTVNAWMKTMEGGYHYTEGMLVPFKVSKRKFRRRIRKALKEFVGEEVTTLLALRALRKMEEVTKECLV